METELINLLGALQMGEAQTHHNITVVPLIFPGDSGPAYLTLGEAIGSNLLIVTEVSQGGSVPELKVINRASSPVLLVDGEELVGAKQNRVLNTSILLKENSETIIPVSCTEHGRWAEVSAAFADSGTHLPHKIRARKSSSVSESLAAHASYQSNQGQVWDGIAGLHAKMGTSSPTGAMRAAFEERRAELGQCQQKFVPVAQQNGLLVLIDGEVAGLDFVSRPQAYEKLHTKLLWSYILEALSEPKSPSLDPSLAHAKARTFVEEIGQCEASRFASVGHGFDLRFKKQDMAGTALLHAERVIHCAFFRLMPEDKVEPMAALHRRRRFTG